MIGKGPFYLVQAAGLPDVAWHDPFGPAEIDGGTLLKCLHCGKRCVARQLVWSAESETWECPHAHCSGSGIGFDLHPVDS